MLTTTTTTTSATTGTKSPMSAEYYIRPATEADVEAINGIVNHEIATSVSNFDYEPRPLDKAFAWYQSVVGNNYPIIVACKKDSEGCEVVGGYAALFPFRTKEGYKFTVEYSLYIHKDHRRKGLGRGLLTELLVIGRAKGYHSVIGGISGGNVASTNLAEEFGFRYVGVFKEVGYKFGEYVDCTFMELILN
ncbi:hypothetical protein DFQ27_002443 [Actinomortierella ambigua]|uniref:N-acetyltransferase domain-containing protein n=1 Tax=Actinomortierella ambigua TaxID=1343610 RepID=A0A9P6Q9L5_9FUNG|nr:hypothetical protein DFQ26_000526 [Actinomortierella ambigua]KAG0262314.1 hypothetical protein DFQ27_002443 [Actinomortierella ambigua]